MHKKKSQGYGQMIMKKRVILTLSVLFVIVLSVFAYKVTCGRCNGSGKDPLTYPCSYCDRGQVDKVESVTCDLCLGKGEVQNSSTGSYQRCPSCRGSGYKNKTVKVTCRSCGGSGSESRPCRTCGGTGKVDDGTGN
jgi:DnaJ-class molecular chaperone